MDKVNSDRKQDLIRYLFEEFAKRCNYCILRNYERLPEYSGDDIDVLFEMTDEEAILLVTSLVHEKGWQCIVRSRKQGFSPIVCFYTTSNTVDTLQIDVYTQFLWRGIHFLDVKGILSNATSFNGYCVASHGADIAVVIMKELLGSGSIREKYWDKIARYVNEDKDGFYDALEEIYESVTHDLFYLARTGNVQKINDMAAQVRLVLRKRSRWKFWKYSVHAFFDRINLFVKPEGKMIAFVGPDGSGKTTLINNLYDYLERFFPHKEVIFHRRYEIFPELHTGLGLSSMKGKIVAEKGNESTSKNEGKNSIGRRSFISKLATWFVVGYYTLEYIVGNGKARRLLRQRTLILYDRYYYDHFVQPVSRDLIWQFRKILLSLVKKPDMIIHLYAKGDDIHKRKQDLPAREIDVQNTYMIRILNCCENVERIDSFELDAEMLAAEAFRKIVGRMYGITVKKS